MSNTDELREQIERAATASRSFGDYESADDSARKDFEAAYEQMIDRLAALTQRIALEAEIQLLRDTAKGFQQELKPEFAKGGQAAINALLAMAVHKERELQELDGGNS